MQGKFTLQAQKAIEYAQYIMEQFRHGYLGTEHLLIGLLHVDHSVAQIALKENGVMEEDILEKIKEVIGFGTGAPVISKDFTPRVKRVFEQSLQLAKQTGTLAIGTEHLLIALLKERS